MWQSTAVPRPLCASSRFAGNTRLLPIGHRPPVAPAVWLPSLRLLSALARLRRCPGAHGRGLARPAIEWRDQNQEASPISSSDLSEYLPSFRLTFGRSASSNPSQSESPCIKSFKIPQLIPQKTLCVLFDLFDVIEIMVKPLVEQFTNADDANFWVHAG